MLNLFLFCGQLNLSSTNKLICKSNTSEQINLPDKPHLGLYLIIRQCIIFKIAEMNTIFRGAKFISWKSLEISEIKENLPLFKVNSS